MSRGSNVCNHCLHCFTVTYLITEDVLLSWSYCRLVAVLTRPCTRVVAVVVAVVVAAAVTWDLVAQARTIDVRYIIIGYLSVFFFGHDEDMYRSAAYASPIGAL